MTTPLKNDHVTHPMYALKNMLSSKTSGLKIDLNPPYQRDVVWNNGDKGKFITSLFEGFVASSVIFNMDNKGCSLNCIDGKQRLSSIMGFMNDEFPITLNGKELYYGNSKKSDDKEYLNDENKALFNNTKLHSITYQDLKYEEQVELFNRNHYGTRMSSGERIKGFIKKKYLKIFDNIISDTKDLLKFWPNLTSDRAKNFLTVSILLLLTTSKDKTYKLSISDIEKFYKKKGMDYSESLEEINKKLSHFDDLVSALEQYDFKDFRGYTWEAFVAEYIDQTKDDDGEFISNATQLRFYLDTYFIKIKNKEDDEENKGFSVSNILSIPALKSLARKSFSKTPPVKKKTKKTKVSKIKKD